MLVALPWPVIAETIITKNAYLECNNGLVNNRLKCQYRLINPQTVTHISASADGKELPIVEQSAYPWENSRTAILFMVDTSDPAREAIISKKKLHIEKMLSFAGSHHQFGLARFDKGLKVVAPIEAPGRELQDSLRTLHATGKITELYRSMLSAIDLMDKIDADRKSIYLFSDGLAEDKAYYHDDVVNAARAAGIIITGLGYPRSVSQAVGLQTVRRLSEETGGPYIEADNNSGLPGTFVDNPFASIDNGGQFTFDVSSLLPARSQQITFTITLEANLDTYQIISTLPLPFPATDKTITEETATRVPARQSSPETSQSVRVITRETAPAPFNKWFWYGIPAALIILLLVTIGILLLSNFRQNRKPAPSQSSSEFKPYAYLVVQDESKKRYAITRTTWRIGRSKDNEMILNDSSVSRRHAEIHRDKGDLFTIYDLDSLNGVYINNNKVSKSLLHEGDIIEIGDINLRFTLLSTDFSVEESTVMQNTRTPMTH